MQAKKVEVVIKMMMMMMMMMIITYLPVDICPQLLVDCAVLNPDLRILKYYWIFL
jgi:hypothetical protein